MGILFLITAILQLIAFVLLEKLDRKRDDLVENLLDFNKRLVRERTNVVQIILNADKTKENYFATLDKIKKELAVSKTH